MSAPSKEEIAELLPMAIARNQWQIEAYEPSSRPDTSRFGGAR